MANPKEKTEETRNNLVEKMSRGETSTTIDRTEDARDLGLGQDEGGLDGHLDGGSEEARRRRIWWLQWGEN
jgi:hypothetical protein